MTKPLKKSIALTLCFCFLFQSTVLAEILPSVFAPAVTSAPLLKYLSVNSANPNNYFNFLMDKGSPVTSRQVTKNASLRGAPAGGDKSDRGRNVRGSAEPSVARPILSNNNLTGEAKKLINYFFLGLTLPSGVFWVNLQPNQEDKITSPELSKTDLGRTLLEQDLQLKKDMADYLHPQNPVGKIFWTKLYESIEKSQDTSHKSQVNLKNFKIQTNNRVWIVPDTVEVVEFDNDGALVAEARLKVLLENEYLQKTEKSENLSSDISLLSSGLMKQIILPEITKQVNESPRYAPLRQVYYSLILAEWYKKKHEKSNHPSPPFAKGGNGGIYNPYAQYLNSGITQGLESTIPWAKDTYYQEYLKSYTQGEYKLKAEISGLKRMYFSGGVQFDAVSSAIKITPASQAINSILKQNLPLTSDSMVLAQSINGAPKGANILEPRLNVMSFEKRAVSPLEDGVIPEVRRFFEGDLVFEGFGSKDRKETVAEAVKMLQAAAEKIEKAFVEAEIPKLSDEIKQGKNDRLSLLRERLFGIYREVINSIEYNSEKQKGEIKFPQNFSMPVIYDMVDKIGEILTLFSFETEEGNKEGIRDLNVYIQVLKDIKFPEKINFDAADKLRESRGEPEMTYKILKENASSAMAIALDLTNSVNEGFSFMTNPLKFERYKFKPLNELSLNKKEDREEILLWTRIFILLIWGNIRLKKEIDIESLMRLTAKYSDLKSYFSMLMYSVNDRSEGYTLSSDIEELVNNFENEFISLDMAGSYWFGHPYQLDKIAEFVASLAALNSQKEVIVLNYGTANGEEALSIGALLNSRFPALKFRIVGKDLIPPNVNLMNFILKKHMPQVFLGKEEEYFVPIDKDVLLPSKKCLTLAELSQGDVVSILEENPDLIGRVDAIVINGVLGAYVKVGDLKLTLEKIEKCLRPGGRLFIANELYSKDWTKKHFRLEMNTLVKNGYFKVIEDGDVSIYEKIVSLSDMEIKNVFKDYVALDQMGKYFYVSLYSWDRISRDEKNKQRVLVDEFYKAGYKFSSEIGSQYKRGELLFSSMPLTLSELRYLLTLGISGLEEANKKQIFTFDPNYVVSQSFEDTRDLSQKDDILRIIVAFSPKDEVLSGIKYDPVVFANPNAEKGFEIFLGERQIIKPPIKLWAYNRITKKFEEITDKVRNSFVKIGQENTLGQEEIIEKKASSPIDKGGIDLNGIEFSLKTENASANLSLEDRKIYQAVLALEKYKFPALALLKIHELMLMVKDGVGWRISQRYLLFNLLNGLQKQLFLDPQALRFLQVIRAQRPTAEIKLVLQ